MTDYTNTYTKCYRYLEAHEKIKYEATWKFEFKLYFTNVNTGSDTFLGSEIGV